MYELSELARVYGALIVDPRGFLRELEPYHAREALQISPGSWVTRPDYWHKNASWESKRILSNWISKLLDLRYASDSWILASGA